MKAYTNTLHVQVLLRGHSPFLAVYYFFFPRKQQMDHVLHAPLWPRMHKLDIHVI